MKQLKDVIHYYLPHDLTVLYMSKYKVSITGMNRSHYDLGLEIKFSNKNIRRCIIISESKPILRPLSDLMEEIEHNGAKFFPSDYLSIHISDLRVMLDNDALILNIHWLDVEKLFEWHFDIFGLIESNQAIKKLRN